MGKKPSQLTRAEQRKFTRSAMKRAGITQQSLAALTKWTGARDALSRATHKQSAAKSDWIVERFLCDIHSGVTNLPGVDQWILHDLALSILQGDHAEIRRIADAVERVGHRCTGSGPTFRITPNDPAERDLVMAAIGDTTRTSGRHVSTMLAQGGKKVSVRTGQRRRKALGLAPGVPGRKKVISIKPVAASKKKPTGAQLKKDISEGFDHFERIRRPRKRA